MILKHKFKSSDRSCSIKKTVLKGFGILTGKHPCWSLFSIKLQAFRTVARLIFYMRSQDFVSHWLNKTLKNLELSINYVLLRNFKWSYANRSIFRTKLDIYDGAFFTSVKPYFKNILNSTELPLSSIFYTTHSYNSENFGRKSLVNDGTFFFRNLKLRNGMSLSINRSSHWRCSIKKGVLREFAKFTEIRMYQSLFFNQV